MKARDKILYFTEGIMYIVVLQLFFFGKLATGIIENANNSFTILTFSRFVYCILGLIIVKIISSLIETSFLYAAGKFFSYYLMSLLAVCILLLADVQISCIQNLSGMITLCSNYFLYRTIDALVLSSDFPKAHIVKNFYYASLILSACFYLIVSGSYKITLIIISYILTLTALLVKTIICWSSFEYYVKKQINFLIKGMLVGFCIFIIVSIMPTIGIIQSFSEQNSTQTLINYYKMNIYKQQADNLRTPWLVCTGIIAAIIFIMERRELLLWGNKKENIVSSFCGVWIMCLDIILKTLLSADFYSFLIINCMIIIPACYIYKKVKCQYIKHDSISEKIQEERKAIAVYIHDSIIQDLIALSYNVGDINIVNNIKKIVKEIRKIGSDIYPTIVEDLGLEIAIKEAIEDIKQQYGTVKILYEYDIDPSLNKHQIDFLLYRAVRELTLNACKHANCNTIEIRIRNKKNHILLTVKDNGHGFSLEELSSKIKKSHIGLKSLSNQVQKAGGIIKFVSGNEGSCFNIIL